MRFMRLWLFLLRLEAQLVHGERLARSSFTLRLSSNIDRLASGCLWT
jgi:hypothetical protein